MKFRTLSILGFTWLFSLSLIGCFGAATKTANPTNPQSSENTLQPPTGLDYQQLAFMYVAGNPLLIDAPSLGGGAVATFSIAPALPSGISINSNTGEISGSSTNSLPVTNYSVTATNAAGSTSETIQLAILPPASINISTGPNFNFGFLQTGSSVDQQITFLNNGGFQATQFTLDTTKLAAPFSVAASQPGTQCPQNNSQVMLPSQGCSLSITFAPTAVGGAASCLTGTFFDGASTQDISLCLSGTGAAPASLTFGTSPTSFGSVYKGSSSKLSLNLTNTGSENATNLAAVFATGTGSYTDISLDGIFPGSNGTCTDTLNAGLSCTLGVIFQPSQDHLNSVAATLKINYMSQGIPEAAVINLSGTGVVPGSLDTSYGTNGYSTIGGGPGATNVFQISNTLVQPNDGKTLVFGTLSQYSATEGPASCSGFYWFVQRFNTDGSVDLSFGDNGMATITLGATDFCYSFSSKMFFQNGAIILTGTGTLSGFAIARLTTAGVLDTSFSSQGYALSDPPYLSGLQCTVQGGADGGGAVNLINGDYVMASPCFSYNGSTRQSGLAYSAFRADGSADTNFGTNGSFAISGESFTGLSFVTLSSSLGVLIDGSILALADQNLLDVSSAGAMVNSFGKNGITALNNIQSFDSSALASQNFSLTVDSSYRTLISIPGSTYTSNLVRLTSALALDATFGTAGVSAPLNSGTISQILPLPDGRLLLAAPNSMQRLLANGAIDTSIPNNYVTFQPVNSGAAETVQLQNDGKYIFTNAFPNAAIFRVWP